MRKLLRNENAFEFSEISKRNLTSSNWDCRLKAMRLLSMCDFDYSSRLLINVADGYLSRTKSFEEEYTSEERSGIRGFFRKLGYLMNTEIDGRNYPADEQLYAMRNLAVQKTRVGLNYLRSLLVVKNHELVNVKGDLKNKLKLIDRTSSSYRHSNVINCPEKYYLATIFSVAELHELFASLH